MTKPRYHLRSAILGFVLLLATLAAPTTRADVRLPALFADNMVLQRGMEVRVWGWADPGELVRVIVGERMWVTMTPDDGQWSVVIGPLATGEAKEVTVAGKNAIVLRNVRIGEVWLCSGQSNMWWPVSYAANAEEEVAEADYPDIRMFTVRRKVVDTPQDDAGGRWAVCSPLTAGSFSAVGYYFGRALHRDLGVPVGLIHSSCGATAAEVWTSWEALASDPDFQSILDRWQRDPTPYSERQAHYQHEIAAWQKASEKAEAEGGTPPPKPRMVFPRRPAGLYNGMLRPLAPFAVRGVIWYQGEANVHRAREYEKLFPTMIENWRTIWGRPELPFLYVQLANYHVMREEPTVSRWAELRDAQRKTLQVPGTGMAVTIDIGEADNIHPANKQEVGRRLSLIALAQVYGEDVVYSGPLVDSVALKDSKLRVRFDHVGGGLKTSDGQAPVGFAVAGNDGRFVWAQARIEGDAVVVWSEQVPDPVAVRYAWADNPVANLYNDEGLPASSFEMTVPTGQR